ncbi:hypothetical protein F53441_675 [Fusarium austroafricanum]|uniref:C2H2-type domain-containing protein n=1 Tax=Fusarium austroafricanum TaxID=2364996 RepID=A0A8H4KW75_9HYPO|nr:hypothetical protein F53441_675 [Fusarium austroafricanum]
MCDDSPSFHTLPMRQRPHQSDHSSLAQRRTKVFGASEYQTPVSNQYNEAGGECATYSSGDWQGSSTEAYSQGQSPFWYPAYDQLKLRLLQLSKDLFRRWMPGVEYTAPPEDRLQPQGRFRAPRRHASPRQLKEEEDIDDDGLVVVSYSAGTRAFFHFACPFYIYDSEKHQQCLLTDGLKSIEGVIEHVMKHHSRPPYCSRCYRSFNTLIDRDDHILNSRCKKQRYQDPSDGVSEDQKVSLIRANDCYLSEKKRWYRIWSIIFPPLERPQSPYLDRGCGLKASMARDFWDLYGVQLVSEVLEHQSLPVAQQKNTHGVLYELGLEDLLNVVIQE